MDSTLLNSACLFVNYDTSEVYHSRPFQSIRLDEKNRYAELLQQFTTTPLSGAAFTGTFARQPKHQHK